MRVAAIAAILAASAAVAYADADPIAEAIRLEAALDYDGALAIVERVIAQGGNERDRLVMLHQFAGRLAAGLDRPALAEQHFAIVLALAPTTTFAPGTSPKITGPFEAARARSAPLHVTAQVDEHAVSITAAPDPTRVVTGIAVRLADGRELREPQRLTVALPAGARVTQVTALDRFGNHVWSEQLAQSGANGGALRLRLERPLYARWPFWATGTALALTAGGICAWRFDSAQSEWNVRRGDGMTDFAELEAIEQRGKRWALAANISFGVAAATTLVAIVTAARGSYQTVIVTAQPDAVGLAVAGGF